jgi:nucleoside 2-deoxyribosyltransferase
MTVYLCGGINGLSDHECRTWREVARARLDYHGISTLDPMRRDYRGKEDESVNEIVAGDLEDIAVSDALLVNAVRPSWGAAMEIVYARRQGKRIIACVGDGPVSPWLRYHCEIRMTLQNALDALIRSELNALIG